ncbi:MAG: aspartate aminotransferase family protein [Chloroflexi bacterium]|nr:aspartate aminotransferase family protein [Chloroflexota bacterium]
MTDWQALEKKYYMQVAKRLPVTLVKGQGVRVWDDKGKSYIDCVAGWAADNLGHCHPAFVAALIEQAQTLTHVSNQFYSVPQVKLAQILMDNSCFDRVFFCNSGAEATEGSVKLARRYGKLHRNGAYEVITANNSFHGRTLAMTAATGQKRFHDPYEPIPVGFVNVDFNNVEAVMAATTEKTCAVMLEPIQGEGGVNVPSDGYLKQVRQWCDRKNLLLILDEVQTGFGRLGTLFGYQLYGVEPDIIALAKGLGGGVAIAAFLAKEKASVFAPGEHGSTFGGNPLACATAYANVKFIIENKIPEHARKIGEYFVGRLQGLRSRFSFITDVRGRGLLLAVEFDRDITDKVVAECIEEGLLLNPLKPNTIRFMSPLIITKKEVDEVVGILEKVLAKV